MIRSPVTENTARLIEQYRSAARVTGGLAYRLTFGAAGRVAVAWTSDSELSGKIGPARTGHRLSGFLSAVYPDDEPLLVGHLNKVASGQEDEQALRFFSQDGSTLLWLKLRSRPAAVDGAGAAEAFGLAEDETARAQAWLGLESQASEREKELSALLEISHNMASTLELQPLLSLILSELKKLVDYTGAAILRPEGSDLIMLDYRGPMLRDQAMRLRLPISGSYGYQKIVAERVPVIISDVLQDTPGSNQFQKSVRQFRPFFGYAYSVLLTPLIVKDRLIGVLRLDHRDRDRFNERHATLALAMANHAAVAVENAQLYERAQQLAKLEERQRIARELHDSISQLLYGIRLGTQTAIELRERDPAAVADSLQYVSDLAAAGLKEMRTLLYELRPEAIASEGLIPGLQKLTAALESRHGITIQQDLGSEPDVSLEIKDALYRIAQEALHNVVKHARANTVVLRLSRAAASVSLEVLDNGVGFVSDQVEPDHMGLLSISGRACKLGGVLDISTAPGEGTRICVIIPVKE